jgi:hypothetical protein
MIKKINIIYLLLFPIFLNQIFNFADKEQAFAINSNSVLTFLSSIILSLFLYLIGKMIKSAFSFSTVSFSIIFYLYSFFMIDISLLFFTDKFSFSEIFLIVNVVWIIIVVYKSRRMTPLIMSLLSFGLLNIFNNIYYDKFTKNQNLFGDVEAVFFPHTKNIYESSYFISMSNPVMSGYPQFTSYIDALLFKISFTDEIYVYMTQSSTIFIFLTVLFFFEVSFSTYSKLFSSLIFLSLVSNSKWLEFLFSASLMSERLVSFTFAVLLYSIFQKSNKNVKYFEFLTFGMMIFTKQFTSTIVLILLIVLITSVKYRRYVLVGLIPSILKELGFLTYFSQLEKDHHIKQIDVQDTVFDLLLLRDLDFTNIYKIIQNLIIDKPLTYLIVLLFTLLLLNIRTGYHKEIDLQIYLLSLILNVTLISLLYISAWRNMELESPIRYILNMLHLKILVIFLLIDRIKN